MLKSKTKKKKLQAYVDYTPKRLYFAYGSNMNQERLEMRVGKVINVGTIRIPGFKLVFNCGINNNYFANMQMTGDFKDFVEGVLYEVSEHQLSLLDGYEGCPWAYQKFIYKYGIDDLYLYICINPKHIPTREDAKVQPEYLSHLFKGCLDNNLKHTYNMLRDSFKHIPYKQKNS